MIAGIRIRTRNGESDCVYSETTGKISVDLENITNNGSGFDLLIRLKSPIVSFRTQDYRWQDFMDTIIAAAFNPKILKLGNGCFIQPNQNIGIWEVHKSDPSLLYWRFNPENSTPITVYEKPDNAKQIASAKQIYDLSNGIQILYSALHAIEFSRSEIPFSAVAVFTDHCDYDTAASIKLQRKFFKSAGITITKGFFLNHFSKRADNASYQQDADELQLWLNDGHELAYHSLEQSLKPTSQSIADFIDFKPPLPGLVTWIDHGYQPYNSSLHKSSGIDDKFYGNILYEKGISSLWNYIDSGTATEGVINQLNTNDFTLGAFYKGTRGLSRKQRMAMMVKNTIFHYFADQKMLLHYKTVAAGVKSILYNRKLNNIFPVMNSLWTLIVAMCGVLLHWNAAKNEPYKLAKYCPLLFKHVIGEKEFTIFQTIEMVDFKKALHPRNVDKLIDEKGIFIAHTYFSAPMNYHTGRMFATPSEIDQTVQQNFLYLGQQISSGKIWNPTLNELTKFLLKFERATLDVDPQGNIIVKESDGISYRTIH
ncbi:MAG TPA: hypothetical protein VF581_04740 [Flavobacterium sp.]|jgi:uncharacterized protein YneR